jgi:hypothetical protein
MLGTKLLCDGGGVVLDAMETLLHKLLYGHGL